MKKYSFVLMSLAVAILFSSCAPTLTAPTPQSGTADFSKYLAVGNSLTAGYADGSLYVSGQNNSYPHILNNQFSLATTTQEFKIPYLLDDNGYPSLKMVMGYSTDCSGATSLGPVNFAGTVNAGNSANISSQGPFSNFGIPGIRVIDYFTIGYGSVFGNPYAARMFSNPLHTTMQEVDAIPHTFFTCWLGNNDVLAYSTGGGEGSSSGTGFSDISPLTTFTSDYDTIVHHLTMNGAKGVCINIPDVTSIPYFTTVPYNGLTIDATTAALLNGALGAAGCSFAAGDNPFVIADPAAPNGLGFRQIKSDEYILLNIPLDSVRCAGWGSLVPIPKKYVLDEGEITNVKNATTAFNNVIANTAAKYGCGVVDMNTYFNTYKSGMVYNGVNYTTTYVTGGLFSLDGVHPNPRGYAMAANEILRVINATFGSTIPYVDSNSFPGVLFP